MATGASQFDTLHTLVNYDIIDWSKVTIFHLDEYVDISEKIILPALGCISNSGFLKKLERLKTFISSMEGLETQRMNLTALPYGKTRS